MNPPRSLIVWGTSSGAGKSWLATALCRVAARRGLRVAPFKAQNMSNNARVVSRADGTPGEIGAAQYFQALAARAEPTAAMNPVLLKPEGDSRSQVVVDGIAEPALASLEWRRRSEHLAVRAKRAFEALATQHELIVVEGAGSPAEINLAEHDYVNLGAARWARALGPTQALLVTDIDRGGAFAHLHGTWALLPEDLRGLLAGCVLNRFRGDVSLLAPGPAMLERATGMPLVGVIPMQRDHGLPEEDGWFGVSAPASSGRRVAVVAAPRISNLDEFAPLARLPGVQLIWAREPRSLEGAEVVILPGSKQTSGDLAWLRRSGLADAVLAHAARGGALLGICGGLQMLGESLHDAQGHDGEVFDHLPGLGLLPLATRFGATKTLRRGSAHFAAMSGPWQPLSGLHVRGYQIRCGRVAAVPGRRANPVLFDADGEPIGWQHGAVLGLAAHGLLEDPALQQAWFGASLPPLEQTFERLADAVEAHLDSDRLARLLGR